MLTFLIVLVYLICFVPLIVHGIKALREKEVSAAAWKESIGVAVGGVFILSVVLWLLGLYPDVLFFRSLGYESVFWKTNLVKWGFFWGAWLIILAVLMVNFFIIKRFVVFLGRKETPKPPPEDERDRRYRTPHWNEREEYGAKALRNNNLLINIFTPILTAITGLIIAIVVAGGWERVLLWANQFPMGTADPIFGKDISFYLFSLPFQQSLSNWTFWILFFLLVENVCLYLVYYYYAKDNESEEAKIRVGERGMGHSVVILAAILGVLIWQRVLGLYQLLYASGGTVYGAGYTDVNVRIGANWFFIAVISLTIVILLARLFWKRNYLFYSLCLIPAVWLVALVIVPACTQQFSVKPNELEKEQQYLAYNIQATRQGFGLDKLDEKELDISETLTQKQLTDNKLILDNIRSWDWRVLDTNYSQKQLFRQYYDFIDIDIDRYMINGNYRQVMLASREMDQSKLDAKAQTWVNKRIKYTHGYGIALNAVNEFSESGMPILLVKDIPPVSSVSEIKITRPEIYFGELTKEHVFVKTTEPEFDYPKGSENVYCFYQGSGGVEIGSGLTRLAFALKFDGMPVLLSNYLTPESRILYYRQIDERVQKIAPFLRYDYDPYMVVDSQGKLWIMKDAYTVSSHYPYSEPYSGEPFNEDINYIRNSVKVVIDPYNGTVDFYIFDEQDPMVRAYQKIFPALFKSKEQMPKDLVSHLRYPEDLIYVQDKVYCAYHMVDPGVFYNKEDLWQIGREIYGKDPQEMIPYFVMARLAGGSDEEFVQMLPFTPKNKENLIGWMAGRCDGDEYGKGQVFKFSKQTLVYGPMQFAARTNQDEEIAKTLALWTQAGSDVIRGNTLIIPIADTLMYFQPLYLKAQQSEMPEIKKVIVAIGDKLDWGDNLNDALARVLGFAPSSTATAPVMLDANVAELLQSIEKHFDEYQRLTGEGKLAEAGQELEQLRIEIERLTKTK
ncbi:MAG: UPF0182 family protein [Candidatus Pacebacteria bacterium]|nr:UPF0182 family protein [Candidatus Paceibacterota bacterium]